MKIKTTRLTLAAGVLLFANHSSLAGGFQVSDHSITSLGRAHAGFGVVGDDASAAQFNPAGMVLLTDKQLQGGLAYSDVSSPVVNLGSTGATTGVNRDGAVNSLSPTFYWISPLNEKMNFGFSITTPLNSDTDYADDSSGRFFGRYNGLKTDIKALDINPSFSYKVNDFLAWGFGISYQRLEATLSGAVSPNALNSVLRVEGDSEQFGYNFGVMLSFKDDSNLGISYRSKVYHDITGTATFSGLGAADGTFDATTNFTSPETVYVGYTKPFSNQWRFSLGYRWTRWSRFQDLLISFPTGIVAQSTGFTTTWNDSSTVMIGIDYSPNQHWTLRTGFAMDQTPIPDNTRSVRTPDADREWFTIGAGYKSGKHWQLDFAYRYIGFDDGPINRPTGTNGAFGSVIGEFRDIEIHTYALQANYKC